jgi:hypothetical protein
MLLRWPWSCAFDSSKARLASWKLFADEDPPRVEFTLVPGIEGTLELSRFMVQARRDR